MVSIKTSLQGSRAAALGAVTAGLLLAAAPAAIAQVPAPPAAPAVAPAPVAPLSSIPGLTVKYYDVTGKTIEELRASMAAQRPVNPATGQPVPSSADWKIGASMQKATTGTECKITGAKATFTGEVVLPRLASAEGVPEPVLAEWNRFAGAAEQRQAASLHYVYNRLPEVERAILASSCEGAAAAGNRVIEDIGKGPPQPQPQPSPAPAATAQ